MAPGVRPGRWVSTLTMGHQLQVDSYIVDGALEKQAARLEVPVGGCRSLNTIEGQGT